MPLTAGATKPVALGKASVIPPSRTQAAVPDETLGHAAVRERLSASRMVSQGR
jgi:hypothetical protein